MSLRKDKYTADVVHEKIDGLVYTNTKFTAMRAIALMGRVVKVLGEPGLQALVMHHAQGLSHVLPRLVLATQPKLLQAAVVMAYGLTEDLQLPVDLCANLKVNQLRLQRIGGPVAPAFDRHFQGEYVHLINVLSFVLAHNFLGFTLGLPSSDGSPTSDATDAESSSPSSDQSEESPSPTCTT